MVQASMNYAVPMAERPRYHANDISRDVLALAPAVVAIVDTRGEQTHLDHEGFELVPHQSAIADFADPAAGLLNRQETEKLISALTGADAVIVGSPGVLRFGEKSAQSGALNNSRPARFVHVDINDATAAMFAERAAPPRRIARFAHYNAWRSFSGAPQDVPLAVCDARSVALADLIEADAVFDEPGKPEWSFVGLVVAANPAHRWRYFSGMTPDEVLVFKTNDSDPTRAHCVPHSAFDDPTCPESAPPRSSIETRAVAYWFE